MGNQLWIEDDENLDVNHPGCMSGILNALVDYHQWHSSVRKILPYGKQDHVTHTKRNRNPKIRLIKNDSFDVQKLLDPETNQHQLVDQRSRKASSTNKRSLTARIRALVSEQGDHQRRRPPGIHARPRLQRTYSIHHLEPSTDWGHPIIFIHKNSEAGATKLSTDNNQLAENHTAQVDKTEQLVETSVSEEIVQEIKLKQNASDHQVKEFVDVLEIFKVNKDLFQNILENNNGQQSSNAKARLTKSGSFPAAYSSCSKSFRPAKLKHKQTEISFWKGEKLADARAPKLVSSKSGPLMTDGSALDLNKGTFSHISRISSLRESTDRYAQLFENSSSRLPKLNMSKSLRLTNENDTQSSSQASLFFRRILSFPHPDNSASINNQESFVDKGAVALPGITEKYIGIDYEEGPDYVNSNVVRNEINPGDEFSACSMVSRNDIDCPEIDVSCDVQSSFTIGGSNYQEKQEENPAEVQPSAVLSPERCFQEEVKIHAEFLDTEDFKCNSFDQKESEINSLHISDTEILLRSSHDELPEKLEIAKQCVKNHRHMIKSCMEDDADFIYVRDILERSGFITNGFQETWYSSDHPLDPSLFEELEYHYSYDEPECFEQEINALCRHLLLFDLVDEVLFDMFERSYTYYPKALSSGCHVRAVPMGQHFLDVVWGNVSKSLSFKPETKPSLDLNFAVSQDLGKDDGWMNLQFDSESLALGLEDLILGELLGEIFCS